MTAPLVFLDTETTGVHPGRRIWEAAMIRRDPGQPDRETQFYVDVNLANADPVGLAIGRFYQRHPLGRVAAGLDDQPHEAIYTREAAALTIARWTHGAHVVAACPWFDTTSFEHLLRRQSLLGGWHYHLIDVEAMMVGYLEGQHAAWVAASQWFQEGSTGRALALKRASDCTKPLQLPWKSNALAEACGIPPQPAEEEHTALGDARHARTIYDTITQ